MWILGPPSIPFFVQLSQLNSSKAPGPDGLPSWFLKENVDVLAKPVSDILNASYRESCLPLSWKMADVSPLAKQKPVQDVSKDLRPISLTPILSKICEDFVVEKFIKPAVLEIVDPHQFGAVPESSTTHALISVVHYLTSVTDGNGCLARLALFDF
jgi:hypothetical protein